MTLNATAETSDESVSAVKRSGLGSPAPGPERGDAGGRVKSREGDPITFGTKGFQGEASRLKFFIKLSDFTN